MNNIIPCKYVCRTQYFSPIRERFFRPCLPATRLIFQKENEEYKRKRKEVVDIILIIFFFLSFFLPWNNLLAGCHDS